MDNELFEKYYKILYDEKFTNIYNISTHDYSTNMLKNLSEQTPTVLFLVGVFRRKVWL